VALYWYLIRRPANREKYGILKGRGLDLALMKRLWRFGGPNGLQFLLEGAGFTLIVMCMGQLDNSFLVATTVAFQINLLAFVPMFGVGIAVSTLVGQQLTSGRSDLAARATWTAIWLGLAYTIVFGVAYIAVPDWFLLGHAVGVPEAEFTEVRLLVAVLLRFVAAYCIFDCLQIMLSCALKGAGDTWFILLTSAVVSLLGVVVGQTGAFLGGELYWWWCVVTGWIVTLCVIYAVRFLQGKWKQMRVIEADGADRVEVDSAFADSPAVEPLVAAEQAADFAA
jgi:MATE family multidrug resistance protein